MAANHPLTEPVYEFEWRQDRHERVMRVRGTLDAAASGHLIDGLIDLGSRRLIIDLTGAEPVTESVMDALDEIEERIGPGRVHVIATLAGERGSQVSA